MCGEHISPGDVAQSFRHRRRVDEIGEQQRDQRPVVCVGEPESREGPQPRPLDLDARLVAEGVPVMTGRDLKDVLRPELKRGPVAHRDPEPARQHDPHVTRLAPVPANMRTHVCGPPPSWLGHNPPNSQVTDVDLLDLDPLELDCLVRAHQVLGSNLAHACILSCGRTHGQQTVTRETAARCGVAPTRIAAPGPLRVDIAGRLS